MTGSGFSKGRLSTYCHHSSHQTCCAHCLKYWNVVNLLAFGYWGSLAFSSARKCVNRPLNCFTHFCHFFDSSQWTMVSFLILFYPHFLKCNYFVLFYFYIFIVFYNIWFIYLVSAFVLFCFVLFCFVLFCFVLFCFVLLCYAMLCYAYAMLCFALLCFALLCFVLFRVMTRNTWSYWVNIYVFLCINFD